MYRDQEAVKFANKQTHSHRVQFMIADSMSLPFQDNSMDVVVCNHIYEHVPEARQMMAEIHRVLREDGFCYFSAGNKFVFIEGHYHLPLLSWLPKLFAHRYLKLLGRGDFYYEDPLSLRGLNRLVKKFGIHDYTLSVIRDPEKFCATDLFNKKTILYKWTHWLAPYLYPWIPTYIWVLTKK